MNTQFLQGIKIGIFVIFAVMIMCTIPVASFAGVIFTESFDSLTDWTCVGLNPPTGWTSTSACTSRSYNGVTHAGGEINAGGRTGKDLKQWKAPGVTEGGYDGYLNYIFTPTEFANHYRTLYSRFYVKFPPQLDASGCIGECPKMGGRIYGNTSAGQNSSTYQILFDLYGSTLKTSYFKIYNVSATPPFDTIYSSQSAASYNLFDGNWHCIEVGIVVGTTGQANGQEHIYIDGTEIETQDGNRNGSNRAVGQTHVEMNWPSNVYITYPIVPGVGNLTVEGTAQWTASDNQWHAIEWDDFIVSTSYIGPDSGASGGGGGGTTSPTLTITSPTSNTTYSTSSSSIAVSGTASDNVAVSSVKWACPTCTTTSGTATGTTSWNVPSIGLASGSNAITFTATNSSNITITDTLTVTSAPTSMVNGACGTASGQSYSSLTSSSPNLCTTGTVALFSGTGPWTWGCNGSGGGTSTASNACSASLSTATLLFSEDFEDTNFAARGWYDGGTFGITTAQHESGSHAASFTFAQGATSPSEMSAGPARLEFTPTSTLYVSFYINFASGWEGSQQLYHPHMINILSDVDDTANKWSPLANNYLNTYIEFLADIGSPYAIRPQFALQDEKNVNTSNGGVPDDLRAVTENRSVNYCNTPLYNSAGGDCYADTTYYSADHWKASTSSLSTGAWHHVEVYMKMNTVTGGKGNTDGIMQEWIDGTQVMNFSNMIYHTGQYPTMKWRQFVVAPYIGDGAPVAETFYIDNLNLWDDLPNSSSFSSVKGVAVKSVTNP